MSWRDTPQVLLFDFFFMRGAGKVVLRSLEVPTSFLDSPVKATRKTPSPRLTPLPSPPPPPPRSTQPFVAKRGTKTLESVPPPGARSPLAFPRTDSTPTHIQPPYLSVQGLRVPRRQYAGFLPPKSSFFFNSRPLSSSEVFAFSWQRRRLLLAVPFFLRFSSIDMAGRRGATFSQDFGSGPRAPG